MNCLEYALRFWKEHPNYILLYNSDHVINVPKGTKVEGFIPIEDFGIGHIKESFDMSDGVLNILYSYLLQIYI